MTHVARFRLFEVTVDMCGRDVPATYSALTASKAMYQAFLDYSECWQCTFQAFLKIAKVRSINPSHVPDGYDYVRRAYGLNPRIGQRCRLKDEGESSGLVGEIVHPGSTSTAHVHVVLDGRDYAVCVHPSSVELL